MQIRTPAMAAVVDPSAPLCIALNFGTIAGALVGALEIAKLPLLPTIQ